MTRLNSATRLDAGLKTWLHHYAYNNYWRVAHIYELADLVQDGYLVYAKCRMHYERSADVRERKHFMALFMTAYRNHVNDIANKCRRVTVEHNTPKDQRGYGNEITVSTMLTIAQTRRGAVGKFLRRPAHLMANNDVDWIDLIFGSVEPEAELRVLISQARSPVSDLIKLFTTETGSALLRRQPQQARETLNQYVCKLIGYDAREYDVLDLFRSFLRGYGNYYVTRDAAT